MRLELIHGDSLQYMKSMSDSSVNLILTDPPYNISKKDKINRSGGKFGNYKDISMDFGEWDHSNILWIDYIDDFIRLLKDNGVLVMFYDWKNINFIMNYLESSGMKIRDIGAWIKSNPAPQARKVKWKSGIELFFIATKNKGSGHHFNWKLGQSVNWHKHSISYKHYHPTQKPLDLIKWIISYWSYEGDTVLDPFLGAGTTMIAAKELNRNCIGIEIDENYVEIAKKLLNWGNGIDIEYIEVR